MRNCVPFINVMGCTAAGIPDEQGEKFKVDVIDTKEYDHRKIG
jgi:hypothetical protein